VLRKRDSRLGYWPPAELLLAPVLVIVLINVLTPTAALFPNQADVLIYLHKAEALARGGFPYRDFALEYPPLALLAMAVPYFAWPWPPNLETYRWLFAAWESLLLVALVIVASRMANRLAREFTSPEGAAASRAIAARVLVLVIVAAPSLAWRFDLLPAVLVALAILCALEGRASFAGVALGLGVLAKIYPLVLVPALAAVWLAPVDRRRLAGFGGGLVATVATGLLPVVLLAGDRAWGFVTYQADRGLQLETLPAGLILLVQGWNGARLPLTFDHGAVQVAGTAAQLYLPVQLLLSSICFVALAAITLTLYRRELRFRGAVQPRTIVAIASAFILLLLVTNKVFSVQYIVWLLPLAAFLSRGQFWLAAVIGALSVGIHPLFYKQLIEQDRAVVWLLNIRNGLVVALLVWVLATLWAGALGRAPVGCSDDPG
jgi:Glycosyltransferase family 87